MARVTARLLTPHERDELLDHSVRGGSITIGQALEYRKAKLEEVELRPDGDVVATASSPKGTYVQLGTDQFDRRTGELYKSALFDALERLATSMVRA